VCGAGTLFFVNVTEHSLDDQLLSPTPSPNVGTQQWLKIAKSFFGAQYPENLSTLRRPEQQQATAV